MSVSTAILSALDTSVAICVGCNAVFPISDLGTCTKCDQFTCQHCDCGCNPKPLITQVISKARNVLFSFVYQNPRYCDLDTTVFVIEDEFGGLEHAAKGISTLIGAEPILDSIFSDQLPAEFSSKYEKRQLAVWGNGNQEPALFVLNRQWATAILPLQVQAQKYTVSFFTNAVDLVL